MIKTFTINDQSSDMRIDRFIKKNIKDIPQGLIEKSLRNGKIKLNSKKVKRQKVCNKFSFYYCKLSKVRFKWCLIIIHRFDMEEI